MEDFAQNNRKDWSEGPLTWDDFQEKQQAIGVSELKFFLGYNTDKQKFSDTTVFRIQTYCYMDRNLSWVLNYYKSDQYLHYNQVIFDLVELQRRKLQYDLDRINSIYQAETRLNLCYTELSNLIDQFQEESKFGQANAVIDQWSSILQSELQSLERMNLPQFSKRNLGYAVHAGLGSGIFTGSLGQHFGPTLNFMFGFDFAYKKSILYLNATLAGDQVKKDYSYEDKTYYQGQRANVAILDVSYGYAVIDGSKIKLSPFAGLGITEISGVNRDNDEDDLRNVDYNIIFGLNADYKIRKRLKLAPNSYFGSKEYVETSVRARLYVSRANFSDDLNGYSINLTLGLCGFGNLIRIDQ